MMKEMELVYYDLHEGVVGFSTRRQGGCSVGNYTAFNINHYCGDDEEAIRVNRGLLCQTLGISDERLILPHQVHRTAEKSKKPKDVFVKQYYEPGEECEFDWGEVKLRIGGKPVTFTMAVFALCHSEGRWAYLFRHQDNLAFMESHRNSFHDSAVTARQYHAK